MTEAIAIPEDVKQESAAIVTWAQSLKIIDPATFETAGEGLKRVKGITKRLADFFTPLKRTQDAAKKAILDAEKTAMSGPEQAERIIKKALMDYSIAEQEKANAIQRKLQAEADAAADKERQENLKKAAAAKRPETIQKYEEKAAAVMPPPVIHVPVSTPKVQGVSMVDTYKFEIVDAKLVPEEYKIVDEKKVGQFARMHKGAQTMPGVRFYTEKTVSSRGS